MREWFAMGGYAPYVWASYALGLAVLAGQALAVRARLRRLARTLGREPADAPDEGA